MNACFTFRTNPNVLADDRIKCDDDSGSPTWVWNNSVQLTSSAVATEDCLQSGHWTVTTAVSTVDGLLERPEIVHDGAFQMLVWEEDDDEIAGGERIHAMTRCGGTAAWGSPELLRTPDLDRESQGILIANPHVVLNRDDNVAHVLFVERDTVAPSSEAWWIRDDSSDCR